MGALITVEEASAEFRVHRTSLYRAMRDGRLQRHKRPGNRYTWVDRDEVVRLLVPDRLTESQVLITAKGVVDSLVENFAESLESRQPGSQSLEATLRRYLAKFLDHYDLAPELDFGARTDVAMMYGRGPGYADRPTLSLRGTAYHQETDSQWGFSLSLDLSDEMSRVRPEAGSVRGIAGPEPYEADARRPRWNLDPRRVRVRDPKGGSGWVPAIAWALDDETGEVEVTLGERMSFAPGETPPSAKRLRVKPADYIIEDEPLAGTITPG
jgi:hypothetical protein